MKGNFTYTTEPCGSTAKIPPAIPVLQGLPGRSDPAPGSGCAVYNGPVLGAARTLAVWMPKALASPEASQQTSFRNDESSNVSILTFFAEMNRDMVPPVQMTSDSLLLSDQNSSVSTAFVHNIYILPYTKTIRSGDGEIILLLFWYSVLYCR